MAKSPFKMSGHTLPGPNQSPLHQEPTDEDLEKRQQIEDAANKGDRGAIIARKYASGGILTKKELAELDTINKAQTDSSTVVKPK